MAGRRVGALLAVSAAAVGVEAWRRSRDRGSFPREVEHAVTVHKPLPEVYAYWRDFAKLPTFMRHLERVEVLDERRSRWTARTPVGREVTWEAEIPDDEPGRRIAWAAKEAPVPNRGEVSFAQAPGEWGTEVRVRMAYDPPAGALGVGVARAFGEEPDQQVREELRRFKSVLECGEVVEVEGQPSARTPRQEWLTRVVGRRLRSEGT